jgi:hypothetical protein
MHLRHLRPIRRAAGMLAAGTALALTVIAGHPSVTMAASCGPIRNSSGQIIGYILCPERVSRIAIDPGCPMCQIDLIGEQYDPVLPAGQQVAGQLAAVAAR